MSANPNEEQQMSVDQLLNRFEESIENAGQPVLIERQPIETGISVDDLRDFFQMLIVRSERNISTTEAELERVERELESAVDEQQRLLRIRRMEVEEELIRTNDEIVRLDDVLSRGIRTLERLARSLDRDTISQVNRLRYESQRDRQTTNNQRAQNNMEEEIQRRNDQQAEQQRIEERIDENYNQQGSDQPLQRPPNLGDINERMEELEGRIVDLTRQRDFHLLEIGVQKNSRDRRRRILEEEDRNNRSPLIIVNPQEMIERRVSERRLSQASRDVVMNVSDQGQLSLNTVPENEVEAVLETLSDCGILQTVANIQIPQNRLTEGVINQVCGVWRIPTNSLISLDLSRCGMSDDLFGALVDGIVMRGDCVKLQSLKIGENSLTSASGRFLFDLFSTNKSITVLDMKRNREFGGLGCSLLFEGLLMNNESQLRNLYLEGCPSICFDEVRDRELPRVVREENKENNILRFLQISKTRIGSCLFLQKLLSRFGGIERLLVHNVGMDDHALIEFSPVIEKIRSLRHVRFSNTHSDSSNGSPNRFGVEGIRCLVRHSNARTQTQQLNDNELNFNTCEIHWRFWTKHMPYGSPDGSYLRDENLEELCPLLPYLSKEVKLNFSFNGLGLSNRCLGKVKVLLRDHMKPRTVMLLFVD